LIEGRLDADSAASIKRRAENVEICKAIEAGPNKLLKVLIQRAA